MNLQSLSLSANVGDLLYLEELRRVTLLGWSRENEIFKKGFERLSDLCVF